MASAPARSRPTNRDEEWRYADAAWLAKADPAELTGWTALRVAEGGAECAIRVVQPGVERLRVSVERDARFSLFALNAAGGPYARLEVEVRLAQGAHFSFGGACVGAGDTVQEFVTRVIHAEPDATSDQVVRVVERGQATGNFLGRIEVARDAQKTDAAQNFRAILLEPGASANTRPELEIFADDVKCAHGAAIGAMDEMAGFYLASRGLPPEAARALLIRAFLADAFAGLEDEAAAEKLLEAALAALGDAA